MGFSNGDYVEYYAGYGVPQVGRVASVRDDGSVFVCCPEYRKEICEALCPQFVK